MESPPPTRTPNPGRPSRSAPIRAMQWISGALHWWGQAEMVILCLRGRSEYSRFSMKKRVVSSSRGWTSNSSSRSIPATGPKWSFHFAASSRPSRAACSCSSAESGLSRRTISTVFGGA